MKNKLISVIIGLVIVLSLVQLVISHSLAAAGEKARQLETKAEELRFKNTVLEEEIAQIGSLSRVLVEAQKIGLIKASRALHLTPQLPVAWGH